MVAPSEPSNRLEHKGYNRGLILGLTMAESMLLLVFCLLLVAAAIVNNERSKVIKAQESLKVAEEAIVSITKERDIAEASVIRINADLDALRIQFQESEEHRKDAVERLRIAESKLQEAAQQLDALTLASVDRKKFDEEWRDLQLAKKQLKEFEDLGVTVEQIEEFQKTLAVLRENSVPEAATALAARLKELKTAEASLSAAKPHEWPPIINLSEARGYFFRSGSAELAKDFEEKLRGTISNQIADSLQRYEVDIIEVIGHTDEQPISRAGSNLDQTFIDVLDGKKPIAGVMPADNAGLGLARAIAVANVLKAEGKLKGATILPMSAAQLVLPGDKLTTGQAGNVENRRRIEIRVRRRNASLAP